jgi:hypothetical protein
MNQEERMKWLGLIAPIVVVFIAALLTDYEGDFTATGMGFVDPLLLFTFVLLVGVPFGLYGLLKISGNSNVATTNNGDYTLRDEEPCLDTANTSDGSTVLMSRLVAFERGFSNIWMWRIPASFIACPKGHVLNVFGINVIMSKVHLHRGSDHNEVEGEALRMLQDHKRFERGVTDLVWGDRYDTTRFAIMGTEGPEFGPDVPSHGVDEAERSDNRAIYDLQTEIKRYREYTTKMASSTPEVNT